MSKSKIFKVSATNIVIKAKDRDSAIQGFVNYVSEDMGNEYFEVKEIPKKRDQVIDRTQD